MFLSICINVFFLLIIIIVLLPLNPRYRATQITQLHLGSILHLRVRLHVYTLQDHLPDLADTFKQNDM